MSGDDIGIVRRMCEGGNGVFHDACLAVCDENVRLRAEVERLRAAGDAVAKRLWRGGGDLADMIAAVAAWEEARREW